MFAGRSIGTNDRESRRAALAVVDQQLDLPVDPLVGSRP
jgi:hypothetical protein